MIHVGAIGEEDIPNCADVLVETVGLDGDFLPDGEIRDGLLGSLPIGLAFFRAVDAADEDAVREVAVPTWFFRSLLDCY